MQKIQLRITGINDISQCITQCTVVILDCKNIPKEVISLTFLGTGLSLWPEVSSGCRARWE